jgi:hypothetical protein
MEAQSIRCRLATAGQSPRRTKRVFHRDRNYAILLGLAEAMALIVSSLATCSAVKSQPTVSNL